MCVRVLSMRKPYNVPILANETFDFFFHFFLLISVLVFIRRCVSITDTGIGYLSTMPCLQILFLRWCSQIRDNGVQHLSTMRSLQVLSLAGKIFYFFKSFIDSKGKVYCQIYFMKIVFEVLSEIGPFFQSGDI